MNTWTVYTLDVWGNARDGFEVNDRSRAGTIQLPDAPSDEDVVRALKTAGRMKPRIRTSSVTIDGDDTWMSVDDAKNGRPVWQLERTQGLSGCTCGRRRRR